MLGYALRLALLALIGSAAAADAQDAARGRSLFQPCTPCHGQQAEGNAAVQAPSLAGLPDWYVARQLRNFREKRRGTDEADTYGMQMAPMALQLWDDGEVVAVSAYVASLPAPTGAATLRGGKASRGKELFATCAACHGADAEGNAELASPPLRGREDWYIVNQLRAFRAGFRGTHAEDTAGQQMRAAAALLTDDQAMTDVATYVATLGLPTRRSR
jgi:cytochrome c oxidase subunit 2